MSTSLSLKGYIIKILIIFVLLISSNAYSFELIAHRGISGKAKENTIESIRNSWEVGANAVEIDVRISKDEVLYLLHDDEINGRKIRALSFQELLNLDKDINKLESIFSLGVPEGYYILDLKDDGDVFVKRIKSLFMSVIFPTNKIAFQSYDLKLLKSLKRDLPNSQIILISKLKRKFPWIIKPSNSKLINKLNENNISIVSIKGRSFIDRDYIKGFKDREIKVIIWNINDFNRINFYRDIGVDGVVTDTISEYMNIIQR